MTGVGMRVWEVLAGRVMGTAKGSGQRGKQVISTNKNKFSVILDYNKITIFNIKNTPKNA